jgi:hypothetical protein
MNAEWLSDFRKIPDEVMNYLRRIAVRAVEDKHHSPELIADVLGISRSCIYDWLRWYRAEGEAAFRYPRGAGGGAGAHPGDGAVAERHDLDLDPGGLWV